MWKVLAFPFPQTWLAVRSVPSSRQIPSVDSPEKALKSHSIISHVTRFPRHERTSRDEMRDVLWANLFEVKRMLLSTREVLSIDDEMTLDELLRTERIFCAARDTGRDGLCDQALAVFLRIFDACEGPLADLSYLLALYYGSMYLDSVKTAGSTIAYSYLEEWALDSIDIAVISHYLIAPDGDAECSQEFFSGWQEAYAHSAQGMEDPKTAVLDTLMWMFDMGEVSPENEAYYSLQCGHAFIKVAHFRDALPYLQRAVELGRAEARPLLADVQCELKDFSWACQTLWSDFWERASVSSLRYFLDIARSYSLYTPAAEWAHTELMFHNAEKAARRIRWFVGGVMVNEKD